MYSGFLGTSFLFLSTYLNCNMGAICAEPRQKYTAERPIIVVTEQVAKLPSEPEKTEENTVQNMDPLTLAKLSSIPAEVKLNVPFTSQAPFKIWTSPYDEACEEAALIMVEYYLKGQAISPSVADQEIKYLVQLETRNGWGIDISSIQVGKLAKDTYRRQPHIYSGRDVTIQNMKHLLAKGYPIIIPAAGQDLNNPNFQGAGPPYHMIVLTGYNKDNFYAHDPGTQYGEHYQYPQQLIQDSIHEWTGSKSTIHEGKKNILILEDPRINKYVAAYSF